MIPLTTIAIEVIVIGGLAVLCRLAWRQVRKRYQRKEAERYRELAIYLHTVSGTRYRHVIARGTPYESIVPCQVCALFDDPTLESAIKFLEEHES